MKTREKKGGDEASRRIPRGNRGREERVISSFYQNKKALGNQKKTEGIAAQKDCTALCKTKTCRSSRWRTPSSQGLKKKKARSRRRSVQTS